MFKRHRRRSLNKVCSCFHKSQWSLNTKRIFFLGLLQELLEDLEKLLQSEEERREWEMMVDQNEEAESDNSV